jgi:hypothetical protein
MRQPQRPLLLTTLPWTHFQGLEQDYCVGVCLFPNYPMLNGSSMWVSKETSRDSSWVGISENSA